MNAEEKKEPKDNGVSVETERSPGIWETILRGIQELRRRHFLIRLDGLSIQKQGDRKRAIIEIGIAARRREHSVEEGSPILTKLSRIDREKQGLNEKKQGFEENSRAAEEDRKRLDETHEGSRNHLSERVKVVSARLRIVHSEYRVKRREVHRLRRDLSRLEKKLESYDSQILKAGAVDSYREGEGDWLRKVSEKAESDRIQQSSLQDKLPTLHRAMEPIREELRYLKRETRSLSRAITSIRKDHTDAIRGIERRLADYRKKMSQVQKREDGLRKQEDDLNFDFGCMILSKKPKNKEMDALYDKLTAAEEEIRRVNEDIRRTRAESQLVESELMKRFYLYTVSGIGLALVLLVLLVYLFSFRGFGTGIASVEEMLHSMPSETSIVFFSDLRSFRSSSIVRKIMEEVPSVNLIPMLGKDSLIRFGMLEEFKGARFLLGGLVFPENAREPLVSMMLWGGFQRDLPRIAEDLFGRFDILPRDGFEIYASHTSNEAVMMMGENLLWIGDIDLIDKVLASRKDSREGLRSSDSMKRLIRGMEKGETVWAACLLSGRVSDEVLEKNHPLETVLKALHTLSLSLSLNGKLYAYFEGETPSRKIAIKVLDVLDTLLPAYKRILTLKDDKLEDVLDGVSYERKGKKLHLWVRLKKRDSVRLAAAITGGEKRLKDE